MIVYAYVCVRGLCVVDAILRKKDDEHFVIEDTQVVEDEVLEQDVASNVTKIPVKEARAQDLRNEILNSEKYVECTRSLFLLGK
nr:DEAD-box ATP-dependent RNA helicase 16 [Tanacetum cinerariifolium]